MTIWRTYLYRYCTKDETDNDIEDENINRPEIISVDMDEEGENEMTRWPNTSRFSYTTYGMCNKCYSTGMTFTECKTCNKKKSNRVLEVKRFLTPVLRAGRDYIVDPQWLSKQLKGKRHAKATKNRYIYWPKDKSWATTVEYWNYEDIAQALKRSYYWLPNEAREQICILKAFEISNAIQGNKVSDKYKILPHKTRETFYMREVLRGRLGWFQTGVRKIKWPL